MDEVKRTLREVEDDDMDLSPSFPKRRFTEIKLRVCRRYLHRERRGTNGFLKFAFNVVAMDDAAGTDFSTYKEIGIELVSPRTGIKYYKPVANSSSKLVVGMCFDSIDEALEFYKQYARSSAFSIRRHTGYKFGGDLKLKYDVETSLNKMEFLPNFTCHYTIKEDGRYEMVFVPFTCIDNHNRNVTVGVALLVVVTDQDVAMKMAIKDVLPRSRHRLCMWHIWDKITSKVGANLCGTTDFKKRLGRIVWDDSIFPGEFERQWPIILSDFNLSEHEWLGDIYNIRHDWIPACYKDEKLSGLMRTTSRCKSENHFFKKFCNRKSNLVEFLSHFDSAIEVQRYDHRKNDHDTRYTDAQLWSTFHLERQAAQIYTRTIFLDQQLEIDYAINNCLAMSTSKVDDFVLVEIKDFLQPCTSYFKVMFREQDLTISCNCNRFEQFGLLCQHSFYVLRIFEIREFPKKYICRR
ncbi:hypothetical protein QVD17_08161 [Tagetes erecta]|uniref:SWIM-type domain-containing protein n=1 Tax=Tagetes erecta TaxID=13708 RepID=A0AAD8L249_TARER|nr:hypothetical protein QVD17_08161 [Tagetes erecta]